VWEWNETGFDGINNTADENREVRGGTWGSVSDPLGASVRFSYSPTFEYDDIGFRVAVVSLESPVVLSSGLLAALKFEGNLSDSSELGLHAGSWFGGGTASYVLQSPGGGVGAGTRSALFNGTTDRIDLANSAALNMNDGVPFSMSAWIKTDFNDGQRVILGKAAAFPRITRCPSLKSVLIHADIEKGTPSFMFSAALFAKSIRSVVPLNRAERVPAPTPPPGDCKT